MALKALPGHVNTERRVLLERYMHAWLTSHALTVGDLARADVRKALLKTLSEDLKDFARQRAGAVAMNLGAELMGFLGNGIANFLGVNR